MTFNRIPQEIAQAMLSFSDKPQAIIGPILALLLLIGLVMDINATLFNLAPVFAPLTLRTGVADGQMNPALTEGMEVNGVTPEEQAKLAAAAQMAVRALIEEQYGTEGTAMLEARQTSIDEEKADV